MNARSLAISALATTLLCSSNGVVHAAPVTTEADALFKAGKSLRDSGKLAEACVAFEQSKRLAPAVGITLYLADCYERQGRAASAWTQFREAEKLARERKDKRADVAHAHATALEPKVNRVVIIVSPAIPLAGAELRVDDVGPVRASEWTTGIAVDAGDHVVTFSVPGSPVRTSKTHIDAATHSVTLTIEDPPAPPPVAPPIVQPLVVPPQESTANVDPRNRRWVGYGLLGAGVVGVGVGAAFLAVKNQSMSNQPGSAPQVDQGAAIASTVAFAAGGAALVSAVILYLTAPADTESAIVITPSPIAGGAGAFVHGTF